MFAPLADGARGGAAVALAALAGVSALFSLIWPRANLPIYLALTVVAFPIGFVLSYVIMATPFYVVIAPIGLARLAARRGQEPPWRWAGGGLIALLSAQAIALPILAALGIGLGGNTVYHDQVALAREHVPAGALVAAGQTGTLGFFRERVVNLDGKVNREALL